ncbi:hypothetical protein MMPV_007936 [Pyropia vietnamensis]
MAAFAAPPPLPLGRPPTATTAAARRSLGRSRRRRPSPPVPAVGVAMQVGGPAGDLGGGGWRAAARGDTPPAWAHLFDGPGGGGGGGRVPPDWDDPRAFTRVRVVGVDAAADAAAGATAWLAPSSRASESGGGYPTAAADAAEGLPLAGLPPALQRLLAAAVAPVMVVPPLSSSSSPLSVWEAGVILFALREAMSVLPWGSADARPAAWVRVAAAAAGGRLASPAALLTVLLGEHCGGRADSGGGGADVGAGGARAAAAAVPTGPPFVITRAVVVEAPSKGGADGVALGGQLWTRRLMRLYGETALAETEEAHAMPAGVAAAVAAALRVPLFVEAPLYEVASCRRGGFVNGGTAAVDDIGGDGAAARAGSSASATPPPWELSAEDVDVGLSAPDLRASLAAAGVGTRLADSRDALVVAALPLMDEVDRRRVLLARAAAAGDADLFESLRAGRSARHVALDEMTVAAAEGRLATAARLGGDAAAAADARADVTQEEGSYDPYLDKDVEYELARRRSMGGP